MSAKYKVYEFSYGTADGTGVLPNNNILYGPYDSVTSAHAAILETFEVESQIPIGITVGIKTGDTIKEYWYNGGHAESNLVEKGGGGASTKEQVGLGNVDNTSDADKPISTATQAALDTKYEKAVSGIPKKDLAVDVQNSLNKADSALQTHQDISGKQNTLTSAQMEAVNSGITATKVAEYNSMASQISSAESNAADAANSAAEALYSASAAELRATSAQASANAAELKLSTIQQQIGSMTTPDGEIIPENIVENVATNAADISIIEEKISNIESVRILESESTDYVSFMDNDGAEIGKITEDGIDFKGIKKDGKNVATEEFVNTSNAVLVENLTTNNSDIQIVYDKLSRIESVSTIENREEIIFTKDNGESVGKITESGLDFNNIFENGKPVATKEYVDSAGTHFETIPTSSSSEIISLENNDGEYVGHIDNDGIHAKDFILQDSNTGEGRPLSSLMEEASRSAIYAFLPEIIYGVVGYEQRLYTTGINFAWDPYAIFSRIFSAIGRNYPRFFQLTPTASREAVISHRMYADDSTLINQINTTLKICNKPTVSPNSSINVLCVGASTTKDGIWVTELNRMLTETTNKDAYNKDAPIGLGLTNINFVGRKKKGNVGYEGTGGWSWTRYTSKGEQAYRFTVTNVNGEPKVGQSFSYTDTSGNAGTVSIAEINITAGVGELRCVDATQGVPASSGTLTKTLNGETITITYSSINDEYYSPFWDGEKTSFVDYANTYCKNEGESDGHIDVCIVYLMPYNEGIQGNDSFDNLIKSAKKFLNALHRDFPNCKVLLVPGVGCSLQWGIEKDNASNKSNTTLSVKRAFYRYLSVVQELVKDSVFSQFCYMVNSMAEADAENIFPTAQITQNTRTTNKEIIGDNGMHFNDRGQMMVADSVFRCFCNVILN